LRYLARAVLVAAVGSHIYQQMYVIELQTVHKF